MTQLWIPGPLPGMNELIAAAKGFKGRGLAYSRLKKQWNDKIALMARAARLAPAPKPAALRFVWVESSKRRDPDNVAGGGRKLILDGLVTAGVLENDGWAHVARWDDQFIVGDTPGVQIRIEAA